MSRRPLVERVGGVALAVVLVAACWHLTQQPTLYHRAVGWFGIVFFGLAGIVAALGLTVEAQSRLRGAVASRVRGWVRAVVPRRKPRTRARLDQR